MANKFKQEEYRCSYKGCKAISDYKTKLGDYCSYHLAVLRKKMGKEFEAEKVELTMTQRKMIKQFRLNPQIKINFKGGK